MAFHRSDKFCLDLQQLAALAKCIGHPARVHILQVLVESGPTTFEKIDASLPLSQSTVSYHLKYLVKQGLLEVEEKLPHTYYGLSTTGFGYQINLVDQLLENLMAKSIQAS